MVNLRGDTPSPPPYRPIFYNHRLRPIQARFAPEIQDVKELTGKILTRRDLALIGGEADSATSRVAGGGGRVRQGGYSPMFLGVNSLNAVMMGRAVDSDWVTDAVHVCWSRREERR